MSLNSPPEWLNDPLSRYLENSRENQFATFHNKRKTFVDLAEIDVMFRKLLDGAMNIRPFLPGQFLLRSHSAFLASCSAVMAGQLNEVHALLRLCLEQGAYALYIGENDERARLWLSRSDSSEARKAVRHEFTSRKVTKAVTTADTALGRAYETLYERTIDYGAHPNEQGASLGSRVEALEDGGMRFSTISLHGDGVFLDFGLKTTAQVGICVLRMAQLIYPARLQATGVIHQLEDLSKRY